MLKSTTAHGTASPWDKSTENRRFFPSSRLYLNQESPSGKNHSDFHSPKINVLGFNSKGRARLMLSAPNLVQVGFSPKAGLQ